MADLERKEGEPENGSAPAWRWMLALLVGAILVAALVAYWMIYPFFHPAPRVAPAWKAARYSEGASPGI